MDVVYRGAPATRRYTPEQLSRISIELSAEDGEVGVGNTVLDDDQASDQAVSGHQYKVSEGNALLIDGWIADQDRTRGTEKAAPHREGTYTVLDANRLFGGKRMVGRARGSETDVARVLAFASLDLPGVDTTWVLNSNTVTLPAKTYTTVGWGELMTDILASGGKTLWIHDKANGSGRCLHYHLRTQGHTCGLTITDVVSAVNNTTHWAPQNPVRQRRAGDLVNDVYAKDQANRTVTVADATSVFIHNEAGLRHDGILDFEAASTAELTTKAQNYLNRFAEDQLTYYCTIGPLDQAALALIRVGDLITVTSGIFGLTAEVLRIAHMTLTLSRDAKGNPITTGTAGSALWDAALELDKGARVESAIYRNRPAPRNPPPYVPPDDEGGGTDWSCILSGGACEDTDPQLVVSLPNGHAARVYYRFTAENDWGSFLVGALKYDASGDTATHLIYSYRTDGGGVTTNLCWNSGDESFCTTAQIEEAGLTQPYAEMLQPSGWSDPTWTLTLQGIEVFHNFGAVVPPGALAVEVVDVIDATTGGSLLPTPDASPAPEVGQYTTEQITLGAGGTGVTNFPYIPGSLEIIGGTVTPDETDPSIGEFDTTLAEGTVVNVRYQIASSGGTGATNPQPTGGTNTTIPAVITDALLRKHGGGDQIQAHGNVGATETFDLANGNLHTATLDANSTFTFTAPESGAGRWLTLKLTQDATGGRTVTWPASVEWPNDVVPTLSTAASAVDWFTFLTTDGGTTWFGFPIGGGGTSSGGEVIKAHGNTGTTETFTIADGTVHTATLDTDSTFTFTSPASGVAWSWTLKLAQDGTGSRLVTWPGSVVWPNGETPELSTAAAAVDWFTFVTLDGGTTWYGFPIGGGGIADPDDVRDAGRWEVVMSPGITDPPEPTWNVDGDDYIYAWVTS